MTAPVIIALEANINFKIIDADTRGYYKIKLDTEGTENAEINGLEGWITAKSAFFKKEGEEGKKEAEKYGACNVSSVMVLISDPGIAKEALEEKDKKIPQPEITPTITHEQYLKLKALTDPISIDDYVNSCEPYDKKLPEIIDSAITNDDRLTALQKSMETEQNSIFKYAVTEGSPGDSGHCVKPTAELSMLVKPKEATLVDPIYPDLIVPPNYAPTEYNLLSPNIIPISTLEDGTIIKDAKDFDNDQLTYDFELLNDKKKTSKGKPVNYLDPFPYDDKIVELEQHHPKIKIDEIEARLYESNHPGDPMPQPVAKNFALVYDAMLKQSSSIEKRLVRIENALATVIRNQGRIGSRININCVYYGGQDTFGKYKTIRCLCDDRIHDASSVTLDQCLSCTRYEPILGQVYDILDETGLNGTVFLDNMQMSYMDIDDLKNLNRVERRNTKNKFAKVNKDQDKPDSVIEQWKTRDKDAYIAKLKKKITDEKELEKMIKDLKEEDYTFKMNWYEQDLDIQKPDVKEYPLEGIKARYKKPNNSNPGEDDYHLKDTILDDETDQDVIKDEVDMDKINNGEWVDTREKSDTVETNNYSTEQYYFEDFNIPRASSGGGSASPGGVFGAEARNKIVEKAKEIVQLHAEGKAGYSQGGGNRTVDDEKRVIGSNSYLSNVFIYDCSSFVSCCYKYAGLMSMYNKNTYDQCRAMIAKNDPKQFWMAKEKDAVSKALPGDLIYKTENGFAVTSSNLGEIINTEHVGIYIGDNKVAHASSGKKPVPKQICIVDVDQFLTDAHFFARPWDLIEADKKAAENNGAGGGEMNGKITTSKGEVFDCVYKFPKAVCTAYTDTNQSAAGAWCTPQDNNIAAAHNIPYETLIYIKELDGKGGGGEVVIKDGSGRVVNTLNLGSKNNGVYAVVDTGGPYYDFDICTYSFYEKSSWDVIVLQWGKHQKKPQSFSGAIKQEGSKFPRYKEAFNNYKSMNGCTVNFWKFNSDDKGLTQSALWLNN